MSNIDTSIDLFPENKFISLEMTAVDLSMHVSFLFLFLSLFFMLYISKLSKHAFDKEIKHNIKKQIKKIVNNKDDKDDKDNSIEDYINKFPTKKMEEVYKGQDPLVANHNEWLFGTVIAANVIMVTFIILIVAILSSLCGHDVRVIELLQKNVVTFIFVGLVEYLFFTQVAFKYIPVLPSVMTTSFVHALQRKF
jgi:Na+-transporting methylmalonyl-CoA/oxaloacetate decarboxylase gamma subunit